MGGSILRTGTRRPVNGVFLFAGLAVGWMKEQFDLLGAEFEERGPRMTEGIRALRPH